MQAKAGHASAWILLSIAYAARSKPAPLADIIAAADFINHAIVTHGELSRSIRNLQELDRGSAEAPPGRFRRRGKLLRGHGKSCMWEYRP